jgi:uronate dehydrogenase
MTTVSSLRVLLTGAAGEIGRALRSGLAGHYALLRSTDVHPLSHPAAGEEIRIADLTSAQAALALTEGIDCIVHFAGVPRENDWMPILQHNVIATFNVFDAARQQGVKRIVFASSNHVTGFYRADRQVSAWDPPRPDSRYAVSKVFGEALGRMYADKHGIAVACLRIGSFRERPRTLRELRTWISPRDTVQLVRRCIDATGLHFAVLYGVSGNRRSNWSDAHRASLGYAPEDDAEAHVLGVHAAADEEGIAARFHGGPTCAKEFSGDPGRVE